MHAILLEQDLALGLAGSERRPEAGDQHIQPSLWPPSDSGFEPCRSRPPAALRVAPVDPLERRGIAIPPIVMMILLQVM
jgi:hypothetical protein